MEGMLEMLFDDDGKLQDPGDTPWGISVEFLDSFVAVVFSLF